MWQFSNYEHTRITMTMYPGNHDATSRITFTFTFFPSSWTNPWNLLDCFFLQALAKVVSKKWAVPISACRSFYMAGYAIWLWTSVCIILLMYHWICAHNEDYDSHRLRPLYCTDPYWLPLSTPEEHKRFPETCCVGHELGRMGNLQRGMWFRWQGTG